ncbi:MAG TPA: inositol 2-dehydrogenase [Propionibacteriaceae bacterium]|nr:inositol 2-dehydrogenase [Propionibacteriaceae bacterium]
MIRFALFGCGRIGRVHADSIDVHPQAELAWVYDPIESAAQEVAKQYGASTAPSVDAAMEDPSVDAVVIASATPTHVDLLTRAVRTGKAVLCEKPIDLDLARVDRCWAEIAALNPTVMVGFNRRFDPSFREVRERIASGEIGRLEQLTIVSRDPAPAPREYLAVSGGLFRDMTIHDFDLARFFLGGVAEVYAMGSNLVADYIAELGDIDGAVVVMRGADGALCQITNSRHSVFGYDQRLEAFGSAGMLSVGNQHPTSVRLSNGTQTEAAPEYLNFFLDRYTPAYRAELDHLITAMEQGGQPNPGFADGREALALADAALESLQTSQTVRLGPL